MEQTTKYLPGRRVTYSYEDTGAFWRVRVRHQYPDATEYTEEMVTTPAVLNKGRLLIVTCPPSPLQSAILTSAIEVPGDRQFADVRDVVNYLIDQNDPENRTHPR